MAANTDVINLADGRQVCLSYGVPVAAFIPGRGYVRTDRRYSTTTSRHANAFAGKHSTVVSDADLRQMIAPVTDSLIGGVRKNPRA